MKKLAVTLIIIAIGSATFLFVRKLNYLALSKNYLDAKKVELFGSEPDFAISLFGEPSDVMKINNEVMVYCYNNYHSMHNPKFPFMFFVTIKNGKIVSLSYEHKSQPSN